MRKSRKLVASVMLACVASLSMVSTAYAEDHKCSPGQQGNPHPGFKPGSCK
jgi:hypothetical protein